jgi:mRNA interferase RelE/StbE
MYSVEFTTTAEKQVYKLPKDIQLRMLRVLERIKIRPFHFVKRKEGTPYFIIRVGEYRAILNIKTNEEKIFVMEVGHRKNIYD